MTEGDAFGVVGDVVVPSVGPGDAVHIAQYLLPLLGVRMVKEKRIHGQSVLRSTLGVGSTQ